MHIHVNVSLKISLRESDFMYVLPFVFAIPMLVLTPTLSKQTLECLPYEVRNESVFTRELTVSPLAVTDRSVTVFYRKVCW